MFTRDWLLKKILFLLYYEIFEVYLTFADVTFGKAAWAATRPRRVLVLQRKILPLISRRLIGCESAWVKQNAKRIVS